MSIELINETTGHWYRIPVQKLYSDGTPMVKMENLPHYPWDTMLVKPDSLMEFVNAMFLVDALNDAGTPIHRLVLPYVPGARQDRSNWRGGDVLFTAKSVANMINERGFRGVSILDPHSEVISSLIDNVVVYPLEKMYTRIWQGYTGVIAPDKGARDRAQTAALTLRKPLVYASKVRDTATGKLTGFEVEQLKPGGHYVVIDDICDGGGTFVGLGEKIAEQGAYADLFVTHGIFSKGTTELKKYYKNIYTTDSHRFNERAEVMTICVVEDMI